MQDRLRASVRFIPHRIVRRPALLAPALGTILVGLLLLVPSGAAAPVHVAPVSPPGTIRTFTAPYLHAIPEISRSVAPSFCNASGGFGSAPHASPRTGDVSVSLFARTSACATQYSTSFVTASMGFVGTNFTALRNGTLAFTFQWNLSLAGRLTAFVPPNTSMYNSDAYAQIYQYDYVLDVNTGVIVAYQFANFYENFTYDSTTNFGGKGVVFATTANATVVAGNVYDLQPTLDLFLSTFAYPGTSSSAVINMATLGEGAQLARITVS